MSNNSNNNSTTGLRINFSVPIAKNSVSWTPSLSQEVPVPSIFKTGNLLEKAISIKNLLLPNSKLPFFIPTLKLDSNFYNPNLTANQPTYYGNTPGPNLLDYFIVMRNNTNTSAAIWYINFVNNYGKSIPNGLITNQTTWSQDYYHCYDFVSDFLLTIQLQVEVPSQHTYLTEFTYIQSTSDLQLTFNEPSDDTYNIEFSKGLIDLLPYRHKIITTGSETTYQIIFNPSPTSTNSESSFVKVDPTRINPFKAIYLCSNNSEIDSIRFNTNNYNNSFTLGYNAPPKTALFIFKYWDKTIRFDSPFTYSTDQPDSNCVKFIADRFNGETLKLSVVLQSTDGVTFFPYIFDTNETVDFVLLTFDSVSTR